MNEWKEIEISQTLDDEESSLQTEESTDRIFQPAEQKFSEFIQQSPHLNEVRSRHNQVLVAAGLQPESHILQQNPDMALQWFVDELNGAFITDGLELPMHGMTLDHINLETTQLDDGQILGRLRLEIENGSLERTFPVPRDGIRNVSFVNGLLRLRW